MPALLALDGDAAPAAPALEDWLATNAGPGATSRAAAAVVAALAAAAPAVAARLARARLPGDPGRTLGVNTVGDSQKALDLAAHDHFLEALSRAPVAAILSEEAHDPISLNPAAPVAVALDPIDGSGSIGIGAPLGTLFAIFPSGTSDPFLRPGREAVAAGYLSFGHSLDLGFTLGNGTMLATFDPASQRFHVEEDRIRLDPHARMIAFNASNRRHWPPGLQHYHDDLLAGRDGPRGRDINMRWLAAAVGELHRILRHGGAFLYPADRRPGYQGGKLRLLYEAVPIALMIEQAGGAASDGTRAILDITPTSHHQHTPLVFGASEEVAHVSRHLCGDATAFGC